MPTPASLESKHSQGQKVPAQGLPDMLAPSPGEAPCGPAPLPLPPAPPPNALQPSFLWADSWGPLPLLLPSGCSLPPPAQSTLTLPTSTYSAGCFLQRNFPTHFVPHQPQGASICPLHSTLTALICCTPAPHLEMPNTLQGVSSTQLLCPQKRKVIYNPSEKHLIPTP